MKIFYTKHWPCTISEKISFTEKERFIFCCDRFQEYTESQGLYMDTVDYTSDVFFGLNIRGDIYDLKFCPFCGEPIELIMEEELEDVPDYEIRTVTHTKPIMTEVTETIRVVKNVETRKRVR